MEANPDANKKTQEKGFGYRQLFIKMGSQGLKERAGTVRKTGGRGRERRQTDSE